MDTIEKVIEAIDKIKYMGGATGPKLAFRMVRNEVEPLARVDSHRVMMFITDGISNINGPSQKEATYLRERGKFEIYAIGKMEHLLRPYLYSVVGTKHYFNTHFAVNRVYLAFALN